MKELKCFLVGEYEYVAAYDKTNARDVLIEMCGPEWASVEDFPDDDIEEVSDKVLDTPWVDEDEDLGNEVVGTLREWLSEVTEPTWLAGTE